MSGILPSNMRTATSRGDTPFLPATIRSSVIDYGKCEISILVPVRDAGSTFCPRPRAGTFTTLVNAGKYDGLSTSWRYARRSLTWKCA